MTACERRTLCEALLGFLKSEYNEAMALEELMELQCVPVAYTLLGENEEHELQVTLNVVMLRLEMELDGRLTDVWQYDTVTSMTRDMEHCSFDELTTLGPNAKRLMEADDE